MACRDARLSMMRIMARRMKAAALPRTIHCRDNARLAVRCAASMIAVGMPITGHPEGLVTATIDEPRGARANQVSCCCDGILPVRCRFGSEGPQRGPGDEVALQIECVVDGGMDTEEALRGSR